MTEPTQIDAACMSYRHDFGLLLPHEQDAIRQHIALKARLTLLETALKAIAALDPETDSRSGWNEWGEAECFNKAQQLARDSL